MPTTKNKKLRAVLVTLPVLHAAPAARDDTVDLPSIESSGVVGRRLQKVAQGTDWSGFTDLYTAGSKSFDVTHSCPGDSVIKGLHVIRDYESAGDIDRYNFELLCTDGSRVDMGPYDVSKDAADWAKPAGDSTVACDGEGNFAVGLWGDRWRNEDGDKDTFEFGLYCADNSFWHTRLGFEVGDDALSDLWAGLAGIGGTLVGTMAGVAASCYFAGCAGAPQAGALLGNLAGSAAVAGAYAGMPSGGDRAEGSAVCSAGLPQRGVQTVNLRKYRKSNGDWDFYDFQIKCAAVADTVQDRVTVTYETCSLETNKWSASGSTFYGFIDGNSDAKVALDVPAPGGAASVTLPRYNGPSLLPRRTSAVSFTPATGATDGWCVQNVKVDGEPLLGVDGASPPTTVFIDGDSTDLAKRNYTWTKSASSWKWDRVALTYEACSARRQLFDDPAAFARNLFSGRLLSSSSTPKVYAYTEDAGEQVLLDYPSAGEFKMEEIYGYEGQNTQASGHGGQFKGRITLKADLGSPWDFGGVACLQNIGINGRRLTLVSPFPSTASSTTFVPLLPYTFEFQDA